VGERSGTENRRLKHHVNLRVDEHSYRLIADAARDAKLKVSDWLRGVLSKEVDGLSLLPTRKPTVRAQLPVDVLALKSMTGHLGQLCGAILLLLDRDRLPFGGAERKEIRQLHDELLAIKRQLLEVLAEVTR
jgi:hypothetical protein